MKPQREIIDELESRLFSFKQDTNLWQVYHFHPEFDILLNLKHRGRFISGDYIGDLEPGTLFLNGPNIPHGLMTEEENENNPSHPSMAVLFFSYSSLGEDFLSRPEMSKLKQFLDNSGSGWEFGPGCREIILAQMMAMPEMSDIERFTSFLNILTLMAETEHKTPMASPGYSPSIKEEHVGRVNTVIEYIRANIENEIRLSDVARHLGMGEKSFCRFFKKNTGRTLIDYVNEMRIGQACKLLLSSDHSILEICYMVGFRNISNFNRRFKMVKKLTPRDYRKTAQHEFTEGSLA